MIKLKIENQDGYVYNLKDENGNDYIINLEFFDIESKPKIGDFLNFHAELLNPEYEGFSTSYTFGNLENIYGKKDIQIDDIDVIKIQIDEKEIDLKRLYG